MLSLNRSFFLPLLLLSLLSLSSLVSAAGAHHEYPDHPGRQQHHRALAARHGASSSSSDASFIGVPPSNAGRRRQRSSSPNRRAVCSASASATSLPAFSLGVLVPNSTSSLLPQATASASLPSNAAYSTVDSGNGILTIYTTHYNTVTVTSTGTALPSLPTASTTVNNIVIPDWSTIAQAAPSAATSMPTVQTNTGVSTVDPAGAGPFSGDGTWFGTGLGACGNWNDPSDHVVAVSRLLFDSWPGASWNPNDNPICNQKIAITLTSTGQTLTATVADRCLECATRDLDMTTGLFTDLLDQGENGLDVGRVGITWKWV